MEHNGDSSVLSEEEIQTEKEQEVSIDTLIQEAEGGQDFILSEVNPSYPSELKIIGTANQNRKRKQNKLSNLKSKFKTVEAAVDNKANNGNSMEHLSEDLYINSLQVTSDFMECIKCGDMAKPAGIDINLYTLTSDKIFENELINENNKDEVHKEKQEEIPTPVETFHSEEVKSTPKINQFDSQILGRQACATVIDMEEEKNFALGRIANNEKSITIIYQARTEFDSDISIAVSSNSNSKSQDLCDAKSEPETLKVPSIKLNSDGSGSGVFQPIDTHTVGSEPEPNAQEIESKAENYKHYSTNISELKKITSEDNANNNYIQESEEDEEVALYNMFGTESQPPVLHAEGIHDILEYNLPQEIPTVGVVGTSECLTTSSTFLTLVQQVEKELIKHLNDPSPLNRFEQNQNSSEISVVIPQVPNPSLELFDSNKVEPEPEDKLPFQYPIKTMQTFESNCPEKAARIHCSPRLYNPLPRCARESRFSNTNTFAQCSLTLGPGMFAFGESEYPDSRIYKPCSEPFDAKTFDIQASGPTSTILRRVSRGLRNFLSCYPRPGQCLKSPAIQDSLK